MKTVSDGQRQDRHDRGRGLFFTGVLLLLAACGGTGGAPAAAPASPAPVLKPVESFDSTAGFAPVSSDGVTFRLDSAPGRIGKALVLDFSFPAPNGYVVAAKPLALALPDEYEFVFYVKGPAPANTLEFKLVDKDGNNYIKRFENFNFTGEWQKVTVPNSQIVFGWGPAGGGAIRQVDKLEIAISCGTGGKGRVLIDDLGLCDLTAGRTKFTPLATASTSEKSEFDAARAVDGNKTTRWASVFADNQWLVLDLGAEREFTGLEIAWEAAHTKVYDILISTDKKTWTPVYTTTSSMGGSEDIYFGRKKARYIKLDLKKRATEWGNSIFEIRIKGPEDEIKLAASSGATPALAACDGSAQTAWHSKGSGEEWLQLDLGRGKGVSGLVIDWDADAASSYEVLLSPDARQWKSLYTTKRGNGGRDRITFPLTDARYVKILCRASTGKGYGIKEVALKGPEATGDQNMVFAIKAEDAPRGYYPKYYLGEATYWTLVGVTEDLSESLVNEEGAFEIDRMQFSIEPFLYADKRFITWGNVKTSQSLQENCLPIPEVKWQDKDLTLTSRFFGYGDPGASSVYAMYKVSNTSSAARSGKLFLAIRPFQVNPPWQKLNMTGGIAKIDSLRNENGVIKVNDSYRVYPLTAPTGFGAEVYAKGDITDYLERGELPAAQSVKDPDGFASGALAYDFRLEPGASASFYLVVPFHPASPAVKIGMSPDEATQYMDGKLAEQAAWWSDRLDRVVFHVPAAAQDYIDTLKSNLAYIFLNRDGFRTQPGSRSYLRSWIRDGALTCAALLRMANIKEVKEYLHWYAGFLFPDGRVPCVVDDRGADPCAENDSNGEFLYGFMQYYNFTHDLDFIKAHESQILKAADFIIAMRNSRKTEEFKNGPDEKRMLYGLVPESISHEGYSAKPMHSYWDDFLSLKGMKDAARLAQLLGKPELAKKYQAEADDFRRCILDSIKITQRIHRIDYIPGCAEMGDFDATSTSIALFPAAEIDHLPKEALAATFDRYYADLAKRLIPGNAWGEAYTPYEIRNAQSFVMMGERKKAHDLFGFLLGDQRPLEWNCWSEVVYRDPKPGRWFGDMPHTWLGSDYIKAVRSLFVYERDGDATLIVAGGIPESWLSEGQVVGIEKAPTYWGVINFTMRRQGGKVVLKLWGDVKAPGGILVRPPVGRKPEIRVKALPAEIVIPL